MTAYFDAIDKEIAEIADQAMHPDTRKKCWADIEEKLVWDATLAAESPGFPQDLRDKLHRLVLEHAVVARPVNDEVNHALRAAFDTFDDAFDTRSTGPREFNDSTITRAQEEAYRRSDLERRVIEDQLKHLAFKLHTLFHELVVRNLPGFSDSPLAPQQVLFARGDAYRETLAAGGDPAAAIAPVDAVDPVGDTAPPSPLPPRPSEWVIRVTDAHGSALVLSADMGEGDSVMVFDTYEAAVTEKSRFDAEKSRFDAPLDGVVYTIEPAPDCLCIEGCDMSVATRCVNACPLHGDPEWDKLQGATVIDPKGLLAPLGDE